MFPETASARLRERNAECVRRRNNFLVLLAVSLIGHVAASLAEVFEQQERSDLVRWCEHAIRAPVGSQLILEGAEIDPTAAKAERRQFLNEPRRKP
jgi:hypothetical protein